MKKLLLCMAIIATVSVSAQPTPVDGTSTGYIISNNNEKLEGTIKESFKKGNIVFTNSAGVKKTNTPAEITGFSNGEELYTAYLNDFYKIVSDGKKGSLLQKLTNNSGKLV